MNYLYNYSFNFIIIVSTILNFVIYKNKHDDDNHLITNINNI
jgi:predicted nucleotidyltransferase